MNTAAHVPSATAVTTATSPTKATHPTPREIVAAALCERAIMEAIQRGARKAQVKKYAAVTESGRGEVRDYSSDFVQATYLALLEHHAEDFTTLAPEQRPRFVEELATRTAWREVYPMKREIPLAVPFDGDQAGRESTGAEVFACDNISLAGRNWAPDWISSHASESEFIERIDRTKTPPEEQPETRYERMCRLLGPEKADWMLDYENNRYESAKAPAERVRYCRLRKKLEM
jgi:hypothetical protein